jgi:cell division protein FtsB
MLRRLNPRWMPVLALNFVGLCVLGLYSPSGAQPPDNLPFANSVEQRQEMIAQLKQINALLKEQNALLKSGRLAVVVVEPPAAVPAPRKR